MREYHSVGVLGSLPSNSSNNNNNDIDDPLPQIPTCPMSMIEVLIRDVLLPEPRPRSSNRFDGHRTISFICRRLNVDTNTNKHQYGYDIHHECHIRNESVIVLHLLVKVHDLDTFAVFAVYIRTLNWVWLIGEMVGERVWKGTRRSCRCRCRSCRQRPQRQVLLYSSSRWC